MVPPSVLNLCIRILISVLIICIRLEHWYFLYIRLSAQVDDIVDDMNDCASDVLDEYRGDISRYNKLLECIYKMWLYIPLQG